MTGFGTRQRVCNLVKYGVQNRNLIIEFYQLSGQRDNLLSAAANAETAYSAIQLGPPAVKAVFDHQFLSEFDSLGGIHSNVSLRAMTRIDSYNSIYATFVD
jgi:hypothetical protein